MSTAPVESLSLATKGSGTTSRTPRPCLVQRKRLLLRLRLLASPASPRSRLSVLRVNKKPIVISQVWPHQSPARQHLHRLLDRLKFLSQFLLPQLPQLQRRSHPHPLLRLRNTQELTRSPRRPHRAPGTPLTRIPLIHFQFPPHRAPKTQNLLIRSHSPFLRRRRALPRLHRYRKRVGHRRPHRCHKQTGHHTPHPHLTTLAHFLVCHQGRMLPQHPLQEGEAPHHLHHPELSHTLQGPPCRLLRLRVISLVVAPVHPHHQGEAPLLLRLPDRCGSRQLPHPHNHPPPSLLRHQCIRSQGSKLPHPLLRQYRHHHRSRCKWPLSRCPPCIRQRLLEVPFRQRRQHHPCRHNSLRHRQLLVAVRALLHLHHHRLLLCLPQTRQRQRPHHLLLSSPNNNLLANPRVMVSLRLPVTQEEMRYLPPLEARVASQLSVKLTSHN